MGLGFDDSESEDEDEYRPRGHFSKKRRIEGDTLEAWGRCMNNVSAIRLIPMKNSAKSGDPSVLRCLPAALVRR